MNSGSDRLFPVSKVDAVDGMKLSKQKIRPCTLNKATQELVSLIFSSDMFKEAMQTMNLGKRWGELWLVMQKKQMAACPRSPALGIKLRPAWHPDALISWVLNFTNLSAVAELWGVQFLVTGSSKVQEMSGLSSSKFGSLILHHEYRQPA